MTEEDDGEQPSGAFPSTPGHGVRFELVLEERSETRAVYQGFAFTPEARIPLVVVAEVARAEARIGGDVTHPNASALIKVVTALVRAATRAELADGSAVPRKIVRWRAL